MNTQEWQNKVKVLLDSNKSALAEMNGINEQLPQAQKKLQELTDKKTAMFTLKFGESLTTEHDCKNLSWRLKSKPIRAVRPSILNSHNLKKRVINWSDLWYF
ncbi:hypothetical protein ACLGAO_01645 [Helicobacter pylori]